MGKPKWNDKNLHHIIGQVNRDNFNVDLPINKIIVEVTKHNALNCLMNCSQDPKWQLRVMVEKRRGNVLSDTAKELLDELLSLPDTEFYLPDLVKKKKKRLYPSSKKHEDDNDIQT